MNVHSNMCSASYYTEQTDMTTMVFCVCVLFMKVHLLINTGNTIQTVR